MVTFKRYIIIVFLCALSSLASATTYYVSSAGNDGANGLSEATPWKTIAMVNSRFSSFMPGDRILFNRGDIFYGTLKFTKSGAAGNPILIGAYGTGSKPIITGFKTVLSWTSYGNGIYYYPLISESNKADIVTVDEVKIPLGRYPDSGWLSYESSSRNYITDNNLSGTPNWAGAEVIIKKLPYLVDRCLITNHSSNTLSYTEDGGTGSTPTNNYGYFIQNDLKTLTTLGEWHYNGANLYMYFGSTTPESKNVKVASLDNAITCPYDYISVENIIFEGYNKNGLELDGSDYFRLTDCEIRFTGRVGIMAGAYNTYENSYIHDTNGNGIRADYQNLTVTNCTLENIAMNDGAGIGYNGQGYGIICGGDNILIQYNILKNVAYDGIFCNGSNVQIKNNFIDNAVAKRFDGGGIYMTGNKTNRIISENIIINISGSVEGTSQAFSLWNTVEGIYLDEPSSGVTVENNTVSNVNGSGIKLHEAHNNIVRNNTLYDNSEGIQILGSGAQPNDPIRNLDLDNNYIIARDPGQVLLVFWSFEDAIPQFGTADNQYYARPVEDGVERDFYTREPSYGEGYKTFAQWLSRSGQDATSYKSSVSVSDVSKIRFEYNASKTNKVVALDGGYLDVKGTKYSGSITLLPYTSAVLMVDPNPSTPPASPSFVSAAVENAAPSRVEMTYNLSLANILPAAAAFTVSVNSAVRTVNSVSISGSKVNLTLASPVAFGDAISVAYTKPSANPLQTSAGGQAASISAQTVTNKVTPPVPVYVSSSVENATPSRVDIVYNLALANIVPATSAFTVMVNSAARTVNSVSVSGSNVLLTLSSPVLSGESVTVAYTKPAGNPLQTTAGGQAASISAQTITNKVTPPVPVPVYVSSSVENATPSRVDLVYNLALSNIVPAAPAFTVLVNSVARTVNSVSVSGSNVLLTLSSPVLSGESVTVAYTKPSANPLQTASGGAAATFSARTVTNRISSPGIPIYVSAAIENATPTKIDITYSLALASIVPVASSFTVLVNSAAKTVNSVAISGTKAILTLTSPVVSGDVVTVAYTKPASNPLQTAAGGQAYTISAQTVTNKVNAIPVPVFTGAGVENATPTVIELYYNLALANIVPALTSFIVKVNSVTKNVIAVSISGSKVLLTLPNGIKAEDIVTVSYTKQASNPLQTPAGGMAGTIGAQQITNKVTPNGPVYVSSVIENASPNTIEVTYNDVLNPSAPGVSAFIVLINGINRPVTSVTIKGKKVILLLESPVVYGDIVTVSYTKPAGNPLQKATGDPAVSIGPQPVTNKVQDLTAVETRKGTITFYPNPAHEFINFSTKAASSESHIVKIFDFSGKLCLETRIDPLVDNLQIPINLRSGVYIVHVIIGSFTVFTHKLLVNN